MARRGRVRMPVHVRDKDLGWRRMRTLARQAEASTVKVGVLAGDKEARQGEAGGLTNTQLAAIHEYGSPERGIPERSFLRATLDEKREDYNRLSATLVKGVFEGRLTVPRALGLLGLQVVADIRARIRKGIQPPLADSTLWRKVAKGRRGRRRSSVPLIDTGQLINSITHLVEASRRGKKRGGP